MQSSEIDPVIFVTRNPLHMTLLSMYVKLELFLAVVFCVSYSSSNH
jgi:hypothetical protein